MSTYTYQSGDPIQVKDFRGTWWPAVYRGECGPGDIKGVLFEINGQTSRTELGNICKDTQPVLAKAGAQTTTR